MVDAVLPNELISYCEHVILAVQSDPPDPRNGNRVIGSKHYEEHVSPNRGLQERESGMSQHSVFYYPYATLGAEQSPLLKAAALYFDKLFILDPLKASWATIGPGEREPDLRLLESEGILQRIAPEEVLLRNDKTIGDAIERDLADPEYRKLCAEKERGRWTLALAKVPQAIRNDPKYQPLDQAMRSLMNDVGKGSGAQYVEGTYDEYRESGAGAIEYRYADYPFMVGEAIMLNHALVGSLLHSDAVPLTDDPLHSRILSYKLQKAGEIPSIRDVLESRQKEQQFAGVSAAAQALTDLQLGVIPKDLSIAQILEYRRKHGSELGLARDKLGWMAREIATEPWTKAFDDEVHHKLIPALHKEMEPAKSSWSSWLKSTGIALGGAAVVLGIFGNPLTPVAVAVAALTVAKDVGIGGLEWYQDWKNGKTQNGLHYLLKLKSS